MKRRATEFFTCLQMQLGRDTNYRKCSFVLETLRTLGVSVWKPAGEGNFEPGSGRSLRRTLMTSDGSDHVKKKKRKDCRSMNISDLLPIMHIHPKSYTITIKFVLEQK